LDGKQYVSFMGGTGIVVATSAPTAPDNTNTVKPKLLTFVLGGKAQLPPAK
jgi:hypothetical protein